ncbi:RNA polymerase sigma factor [Pleionea sp. CnH1-48]|uniref:RNA polymerase sigma factor n=1 Tax=Pleionea sp. CnH1-48 TaxID=2954494 RepID=UPI00209717B8|nr:RNA polymerase sigma factor [Pleionea sp. CnH1-48]MCO7226780.1 RNA polymerase sigma factor [Pleionea sp. CnH1-48]
MMLLNDSDEKLIDKALNGSQRAWGKLVRRYEGKVYNYCLRMSGSQNDAMDLMQEVFLAVYRNLPNFRQQSSFTTWLFRIASNKSTDWLRSRHRVPTLNADELPTDHTPGSGSPQQSLQQDRDNQHIMHMLGELSAEQRVVVELKFFQHFTFEDIAAQLGISTNTAKTRLYAGLRRLKGKMEIQNAM